MSRMNAHAIITIMNFYRPVFMMVDNIHVWILELQSFKPSLIVCRRFRLPSTTRCFEEFSVEWRHLNTSNKGCNTSKTKLKALFLRRLFNEKEFGFIILIHPLISYKNIFTLGIVDTELHKQSTDSQHASDEER